MWQLRTATWSFYILFLSLFPFIPLAPFLVPKQSSDNKNGSQFPGPRLQSYWFPFWYTF